MISVWLWKPGIALNEQSLPDKSSVASPQQLGVWFRAAVEWEAHCLLETAASTAEQAARAATLILECRGKIVVAGMGKMGHVGRKAAATFCSTGTPAVFLHPGEAFHGDLGVVSPGDLLIALSTSGETAEVVELIPFMRRHAVPVIAVTCRAGSALGKQADALITMQVEREADPIATAPTASTTAALAICDGLAIAVMHSRGFTREQFAEFHPAGLIGRKLLTKISTLMHGGERLPLAGLETSVREAIVVISGKALGCVFIVDADGRLAGIFTDGDLRRTLGQAANPLDDLVARHMTRAPRTIGPAALAVEAIRLMESRSITVLPVVDDEGRPVGAVHLHDLVQAGLV